MPELDTLDSLKEREVINVCDGRRLGYVSNAELDLCTGRLTAIIVPGECNFLGIPKGDDIIIPWECIERLGRDIILVRVEGEYRRMPRPKKKPFKFVN